MKHSHKTRNYLFGAISGVSGNFKAGFKIIGQRGTTESSEAKNQLKIDLFFEKFNNRVYFCEK
jgi:hypothetical protein